MKNWMMLGLFLLVSGTNVKAATVAPDLCEITVQIAKGQPHYAFNFMDKITVDGKTMTTSPKRDEHHRLYRPRWHHFMYEVDADTCAALKDWFVSNYKSNYEHLRVTFNGVRSDY